MCEKQEIIYEKNTRKFKLLSIVLMVSLVLGVGLSTEVRAKSKMEKGLLDIRSAGASEFNPSKDQQTFMCQLWIVPTENGLTPSYQELSLQDLMKNIGMFWQINLFD